jgi:hypothetical protein
MFRFFKVLFLLYMGNSIGNRFRRAPLKLQALDATRKAGRNRYSLKSDKLWEGGSISKRYKIKYRSEWENKNGDPVFYRKGDDPWIISPNIYPNVAGCFSANPGGLNIDPNTGEIDVNNSDTGISYVVEFTPCGQASGARTTVVIGGVGFQGGITSLSSDQPLISKPHYYGHGPEQDVPSYAIPEGRYGYIPENVKPSANLKGLYMDERTGEIDLRKTVLSGSLGFRPEGTFPVNGNSKEFKLYYNLETPQSRGITNYTTIRIHFFDTEADIPDELLARMRQTSNSIFERETVFQKGLALPLMLGVPYAWLGDTPWEALAALLTALTSLLLLNAHQSNNPLRPPEHVVTQ